MVGRDEELRAAAATLGPRSDRAGVVLSGPAGVGKTRLAREVVARIAKDRPVHWVLATESARSVPLAAFGGILDGIGQPGPTVLDRAVEQLACRPAGRPVLAVDDAHLLDDLSAVLVHRLATRRNADVVLTTRIGEPAPDAISSLWKDEHLMWAQVPPLADTAVIDLVERVLGGSLASGSARRIVELTRGNALFLRLLVDGEVAAERLVRRHGVWCWSDAPGISGALADIVRHQMGEVPRRVRDAVDVLALAEPLGIETVDSLVGRAALEQAEQQGLVEVTREGDRWQARLAHPMYGEVRRIDLGQFQARRLRGTVATTMLATGEAEQDLVRRAVLLVDSDQPPDPALFLQAAVAAMEHFDVVLGERLARSAVSAGADFEAQLALAVSLSFLPRPTEAEQLLADLAMSAPTDEDRTRVAVLRVGNLFWTLRRPAEAARVLGEELAVPRAADARAPLLGIGVAVDASLGRIEAALDTGPSLLAQGRLTDVAAVMAAGGTVLAAGVAGLLDVVGEAGATGHDAATGVFTSFGPHFGLGDWGVMALRLGGEIAQAEALAAEIVRDVSHGPGPVVPMSRMLSGQAALAAGRINDALRDLGEARAGLPATHPFTDRTLLFLCQATAIAGRPAEARRVHADLVDVDVVLNVLTLPEQLVAQAWVEAAEGAVSTGIATAREAAERARSQREPAYEVLALQTATQFGDTTGVARLAQLTRIVQGPRAQAALAHARALAAQDGEALAVASQRWEEIRDGLAAADAAAQAAVLLRAAGRKGSAAVAAARAQHLAEVRCQGAYTPAVRAAAQPLPLTDREREIATLAAAGHSNKEIAARLTVSVRTIEGHLYRASQKLGVHDRSELAALLAIE